MNNELQRAREGAAQLQTNLNGREAEVNRLTANLGTVREQANGLRREKDALTGQVNGKNQEIARLEREVAAWEAKEAQLRQREANQAELERSVVILNTRWNNRKQRQPLNLKDAQESIDRLTQERDELEEEVKKQDRLIDSIVEEMRRKWGITINFN